MTINILDDSLDEHETSFEKSPVKDVSCSVSKSHILKPGDAKKALSIYDI